MKNNKKVLVLPEMISWLKREWGLSLITSYLIKVIKRSVELFKDDPTDVHHPKQSADSHQSVHKSVQFSHCDPFPQQISIHDKIGEATDNYQNQQNVHNVFLNIKSYQRFINN